MTNKSTTGMPKQDNYVIPNAYMKLLGHDLLVRKCKPIYYMIYY